MGLNIYSLQSALCSLFCSQPFHQMCPSASGTSPKARNLVFCSVKPVTVFSLSHLPTLMPVHDSLLLSLGFLLFHIIVLYLCFVSRFEVFIFMTAQPDTRQPIECISILGKDTKWTPKYVTNMIFVALIFSSSSFSRLCRGIYGLI